jgi:hypothetical protein
MDPRARSKKKGLCALPCCTSSKGALKSAA